MVGSTASPVSKKPPLTQKSAAIFYPRANDLTFTQFRDAEKEKPNLAQLRGSGSIEQDADVVLFLHRDRNPMEKDSPQEACCIVAKQRNGATGEVEMMFFPSITKFENKVAGEED